MTLSQMINRIKSIMRSDTTYSEQEIRDFYRKVRAMADREL